MNFTKSIIEKNTKKTINILYYLLLVLVTGFVGYISLGKGFDFDVINDVGGDGYFALEIIKSIQENGFVGIWFNYRVGAPGISTLIDYPVYGNIDVLIYCILSWFIDSTSRILYYFLILSFILDGISMSLLLRKLKFNRETAFVISCLFSFAPYHFYRYLAHSSLIMYFTIPIALYLGCYIVGIIEEDKKWKLIVATILLGLGYGYYYAFGLIIIAIAYVIRFIRLSCKKDIFKQLWIAVLLCSSIVAGLLPKIIYSFINGSNAAVGIRAFYEQEIYGLKIINLLLPVTYSKIDALRELTYSYMSSGAPLVNENSSASLGFVASVGFIILCITFIISYVNKKKCEGKEWELIDYLAILTLTFLLMGAIGGFGEIFNWLVTAQIRCYNRSSIVITCFALIMVAVLVNKIRERGKWTSIICCVLILSVGAFDQINIYPDNWQAGCREKQDIYEVYFAEVEAALGEGAMVYQLPYVEFPEAGGRNGVGDYKLFAGFLFTDTLRWSYGSIKGRDEEVRSFNIDNGMSFYFLKEIKAAGFDAVYIDIDAYDAYVGESGQILSFYNGLGITPLISGDGKLYTYDISNLEINENWLTPGWSFVWSWANTYGIEMDSDSLAELARGLTEMDTSKLSVLFDWISESDIVSTSDEEYVEFLYNKLLQRQADEEGLASYVNALSTGVSKEDIFYIFVCSEEFRNVWEIEK